MKKLLFFIITLFTFTAHAQEVQKEIDQQVWKPFTKAIMSQDVTSFLSVHSKDLVRAERNSKRVLNIEEYKKAMEMSWPRWKESIKKDQITYTFELRFTERINNADMAYEVGYFKNEDVTKAGEKKVYYGKFQVALRKENGVWKILVDSDSNDDGKITEKDFLAARPIE
ncbi:MAG: nuclear transport factor 2 family protein [Cyclobacteriaceae bacterium]|nr:nuclear transport factor 2 family protein [Cyclobacteriaceae bacterium]